MGWPPGSLARGYEYARRDSAAAAAGAAAAAVQADATLGRFWLQWALGATPGRAPPLNALLGATQKEK